MVTISGDPRRTRGLLTGEAAPVAIVGGVNVLLDPAVTRIKTVVQGW